MKKIFCTIIIVLCFAGFSQAQINRAKAPKPGPAPEINIGTPASFTMANGIRVFVVSNHSVPKVTASLILKLDPVQEGNKAGYVSMVGDMMRRGTTTKSKAALDEEIDFLGGNVSTSSDGASASGLTDNFDKLFAIFSDVMLNPSFADSELVKVKKQALSSLKAAQDDPSSISSNVTSVVNYGKNFPYGEVETEATVNNIATDDLKSYHHDYWKPNVAYMAFVGDITEAHAKELVTKYLSNWKEGDVPAHAYNIPQKPAKVLITVVDRPSAVQTNINITAPIVLSPGDMDNFPVSVMNQILGGGTSGRLFQDLREKHGYTYGAYSSVSNDPIIGSFSASAAVRTAVTDSSLMRFMYELNLIRDEKVDEKKLDSAKNQLSGNFALSLERPARIAQFALNIARYNMPADYYKNYLKSIAAVTPDDIERAAQKYITPGQANIVLVGNSKDFAKQLPQFGEVQYVDIYGNPVAAPDNKEIPAGVTAGSIIQNYLKAIGGEEKLKTVKDLSLKATASAMGQEIVLQQSYLMPDKYKMTLMLPSQNLTIVKILVNGDSVNMEQMGQSIPLTSEKKTEMKDQANPFQEMNFLHGKYTLKLKGIEPVNGSDAYSVAVTNDAGKTTTYYFDTKTGYEVRSVSTEKTPQGEVSNTTDLSDYKPVDGVTFPFSISTQNGPQKIDFTVQEVKVNSGLKESDFE